MRRCHRAYLCWLGLIGALLGPDRGRSEDAPPHPSPARGEQALTAHGYLSAGWSRSAYDKALATAGVADAPDPMADPAGYAAAFARRYGLHPAPYPNDGLPMGLRMAPGRAGAPPGVQIDCMVCHGGSIGGTSMVGLGNTQLDLKSLFDDLTRADGRKPPPPLFVLNSSRGTVNAGMVAAVLLSFRNPDLSPRTIPLPLGAKLPELDTPPWWHLAKKSTKYYDGRTPADSVRSNMQFLLAELDRAGFERLEPTFADIQSYLKTIRPPKYPLPIDPAKAERGRAVFEANCARCHGTYGARSTYPNKIIPLQIIGTDPARALGITDRLVAHYNSSWFGAEFPADEVMSGYQAPPLDGIWATAPYLHNGSVPTVYHLLNSSERPSRFRRPPSTDLEHYDPVRLGWKAEAVEDGPFDADDRSLFDSSRFGLGNGGHTFGDALREDERQEVIEYLKTL